MPSYLRSSLLAAERMRVPTAISTIASSTAPIVTSATPTAISIGQGWVVRPAQRSDLWAAAELMHDSFAGGPKGGVDRWLTTVRLALDLEQRMTPWAWSRHLQLVAEEADSSSGDGLIGFAELWAEDDKCVEDTEASVPQPALFNVCVAEAAQGRGIGRELMSVSESQCRTWGERFVFLKVREGNSRALELYRRSSYEIFDSRVPLDVPAWQEQWKGGTPGTPLTLMRKRIDLPLERLLERLPGRQEWSGKKGVQRIKSLDPLSLSVEDVRDFGDADAWVWFALLVGRNVGSLSPLYALVPAVAGVLTVALVSVLSQV